MDSLNKIGNCLPIVNKTAREHHQGPQTGDGHRLFPRVQSQS